VRAKLEGTLSALLRSPTGLTAYISGHVAGKKGVDVHALTRDGVQVYLGKVSDCRDDDWKDCASIEGVDETHATELAIAKVKIRTVNPNNIGLRVYVGVAGHQYPVATKLHGVDCEINVDKRNFMRGLLELASKVTDEGDSGAPVFDADRNLIGLVVGASSDHTYVLPAKRGLCVAD
jgi:hypothetical protein